MADYIVGNYVLFLVGALVVLPIVGILLGVVLGAWVMFKGKSTTPNERFIGPSSKGEVFSITDDSDRDIFPGSEEPTKDEKRVLAKTNEFLEKLSRTKKG